MSKSKIAQRMHDIGLCYEVTGVDPSFIFSGGRAIVANWSHGDEHRSFVGFYPDDDDESSLVVSRAREMRGVHTVYIVTSEKQDD